MTSGAFGVPRVKGSSLAGTAHLLPGTLQGELNLLLVAFRQSHQSDVDSWSPLTSRLEQEFPGFRAYEIPVIGRRYRWMAGFIDGGMRAAIPDQRVREATITLYVDKDWFRQSLDIAGEEDIVLVLADREGRILWRANGCFSDGLGDELARAVGEHFGHAR